MQKANTIHFSIIPLFIIVLLNEISYQMVIPTMNHVINLTLPYASEALKTTLYGGGIATFTLAVMLGSPVIGFLSDRFGRKMILTACLLLMIGSSVLFIFSFYFHHIAYFLIARFLSGIAGASTAIVQAAIADTSTHRIRSVHFSTMGFALTVGLIVGPLLGGYFIKVDTVSAFMLSLPFMLTASISLINMILFWLLFQETASHHSDYENLTLHFTYGKTAKFLLVFFLLEFSWSLYFLTLPTYLTHTFFYDSRDISLFMSTAGIAMCFGLLAYRIVSRYLNNTLITQLFFGLFILSLIIIIVTKNISLHWIALIPITWSVAISYVAVMGLLSESVRSIHQGTLMGTTLTIMALAWTLTGAGAKFLFSLYSSLPFVVSMISLGVGITLMKYPIYYTKKTYSQKNC